MAANGCLTLTKNWIYWGIGGISASCPGPTRSPTFPHAGSEHPKFTDVRNGKMDERPIAARCFAIRIGPSAAVSSLSNMLVNTEIRPATMTCFFCVI